tara:strand:- start:999 stop:1109 length:111 start_codon:yes stop_codon:yes gene_type:complete
MENIFEIIEESKNKPHVEAQSRISKVPNFITIGQGL